MTAAFAAQAAVQIPSGRLADRFGARRGAMLGIGVTVLGNGAALVSPSLGLAFAARLATGVGTALCFVCGSDYLRAAGGGALAQGVYGGIGGASSGLALAIVPQVERLLGWRSGWVTAVAVALVAGLAMATAPADSRLGRARTPARGSHPPARGRFLDAWLLRLAVFTGFSFGFSIVMGNWIVTLLQRTGGYSLGEAGAIGSLTLMLSIVARPLGGWLLRSFPRYGRPLMVASCVVGAAATAALLVPRPAIVPAAAAALVGLAAGVPFAYVVGTAARARPDAPAAAMAAATVGVALTTVVATPLVGLGFSAPFDGRIGFVAMAALWAFAIVVLPPPPAGYRAARAEAGG